jgi:hypothetical protein
MRVRRVEAEDWSEWWRSRRAVRPDDKPAADEGEMRGWLARGDAIVVVCAHETGGLCGFAKAGPRP